MVRHASAIARDARRCRDPDAASAFFSPSALDYLCAAGSIHHPGSCTSKKVVVQVSNSSTIACHGHSGGWWSGWPLSVSPRWETAQNPAICLYVGTVGYIFASFSFVFSTLRTDSRVAGRLPPFQRDI